MNRVYGEPVNVQARDDGRPARFVWRGRLYTVRAILEHWVINREWWRDPEAEPGQPRTRVLARRGLPGTRRDTRRIRTAPGNRHGCLDPALSRAPQVLDVPLR